MTMTEPLMSRAARWLTFGSAVSILFSIAISQSLLALALAALLLSGEKLRIPPVKLPLALFLLGTFVALALSEHPAVDANWRALSLEYLRHQERDGEGEGAAGQQ